MICPRHVFRENVAKKMWTSVRTHKIIMHYDLKGKLWANDKTDKIAHC